MIDPARNFRGRVIALTDALTDALKPFILFSNRAGGADASMKGFDE